MEVLIKNVYNSLLSTSNDVDMEILLNICHHTTPGVELI